MVSQVGTYIAEFPDPFSLAYNGQVEVTPESPHKQKVMFLLRYLLWSPRLLCPVDPEVTVLLMAVTALTHLFWMDPFHA